MADPVSGKVAFTPLREADLPLLQAWLDTPHVSEWWAVSGHHHPSLEVVAAKYLPRVRGDEPVHCYLFHYGPEPIGMIQSYDLNEFPVEKAIFGLEGNGTGIDLCIGEEAYVHRGLGSGIIQRFIKEKVFSKDEIDWCCIDPDPRNVIAVKAYQKAGFRHVKTVWNGKDEVEAYLMVIDRDALTAP